MDPAPSPPVAAPDPALLKRFTLEARLKAGASWFLWIAGLSLVNSIVVHSGNQWGFFVGLGITQVIDALGLHLPSPAATIVPLGLNVIVTGGFVIVGIFARRRLAWVFILGMALYFLDGMIFALLSAWVEFGFHIFALVMMASGLGALTELKKLEAAPKPA